MSFIHIYIITYIYDYYIICIYDNKQKSLFITSFDISKRILVTFGFFSLLHSISSYRNSNCGNKHFYKYSLILMSVVLLCFFFEGNERASQKKLVFCNFLKGNFFHK